MNSGLYRVCLGRFDWATSAWHGDSSVIISLTFSSAGATSESLDTFENSFGGTFGRRIWWRSPRRPSSPLDAASRFSLCFLSFFPFFSFFFKFNENIPSRLVELGIRFDFTGFFFNLLYRFFLLCGALLRKWVKIRRLMAARVLSLVWRWIDESERVKEKKRKKKKNTEREIHQAKKTKHSQGPIVGLSKVRSEEPINSSQSRAAHIQRKKTKRKRKKMVAKKKKQNK